MSRPLVAVVAAATVLVTACAPMSLTTTSTAAEAPRTVSVSATGQAEAVPDAARASLTVEVTDPSSAQAAQQAAAEAATAVLGALTAAGVADADVATQGVSVGPQYNYTSDGGQELIGYRAAQTIEVTVAAGGNAVRVDSLSPFVTDPTVAASAARAQAVEIASAEAEQYAQLLDFTLGPVASVSESSSTVAPPPIAYAEDAAASAEKVTTPIEPGTTLVSVTLNVAWAIED